MACSKAGTLTGAGSLPNLALAIKDLICFAGFVQWFRNEAREKKGESNGFRRSEFWVGVMDAAQICTVGRGWRSESWHHECCECRTAGRSPGPQHDGRSI